MSQAVPLRYHAQAAQELTGARGREVNADYLRLLEERERRLGVRLPESAREWYAVFGSLRDCCGEDDPIPLEQLGEPLRLRGAEVYDAVANGYLLLMRENEDRCTWAVVLDGSDDPPVVLTPDLAPYRRDWRPVADHFSTFIWARVWSRWGVLGADNLWAHTWVNRTSPLGPRELAFLRANYREGPQTTDWPGGVHLHFANGEAYLWLNDHPGEQCVWQAGAGLITATGADLEPVTRELWWLVGLPDHWQGEDMDDLLERVEAAPPPYPGPGWQKVFGDDLAARFANGCWLHSRADVAVVPPCLDYLRDSFDEAEDGCAAITDLAVYRLSRPGQRVYLITEDHRSAGARACWWLHADTEEELEALARHVWHWGDLDRTLEAGTDVGRRVLERLRSGGRT
jgi:hypothetical protein